MGRKRSPEPKKKLCQVYLTEADYGRLQKAAWDRSAPGAHLPVSALIREIVLAYLDKERS